MQILLLKTALMRKLELVFFCHHPFLVDVADENSTYMRGVYIDKHMTDEKDYFSPSPHSTPPPPPSSYYNYLLVYIHIIPTTNA